MSEDLVGATDTEVTQLQLSRAEFRRGRLARDVLPAGGAVTAADLARFSETFADLADPDVMSHAWL